MRIRSINYFGRQGREGGGVENISVLRRRTLVRCKISESTSFPFLAKADANDVSRNKQGASGLLEGGGSLVNVR